MTGIERLVDIVNDGPYSGGMVHISVQKLREICEQIEREQDAAVKDSPYDAILTEDREAIAWVREHGGLGAVKRRWKCLSYCDDPVPRSYMEKRLARLKRQIDENHAALRRKNQRIAVLASEINRAHNENHMEFMRRAGNYTAFADEVCERLAPHLRHMEGCTKGVMDAALDALDRRLMPEGYEWPRFEDGEPVRIGDDAPFGADGVMRVVGVEINRFGYALHGSIDDGMRERVDGDDHGVPVKRYEPKVLDADGVEIRRGDTVWSLGGGGPYAVAGFDGGAPYVLCDDGKGSVPALESSALTHRAPVLAADGKPLEVGQTVWHEDGTELKVLDFGHEEDGEIMVSVEYVDGPSNWSSVRNLSLTHNKLRAADGKPFKAVETVWDVESGTEYKVIGIYIDEENPVRVMRTDGSQLAKATKPSTLTHQRPVLDADGVPINEGDTVYFTDGREQECNTVVNAKYDYKDEPYVQLGRLNEVGYPTYTNCSCIDPSQLTHTKPEPETWERIEADALVIDQLIDSEWGGECTDARDLVRRAKALAGVSE